MTAFARRASRTIIRSAPRAISRPRAETSRRRLSAAPPRAETSRRRLSAAPPRAKTSRRRLSAAPPAHYPLPDLGAALAPHLSALNQNGYAVVDGALGETWCHLLRDDIVTLAERRLLGRNATHLVKGGRTTLLQKEGIFEAEPGADGSRSLCPRLARLLDDGGLRRGLSGGLGLALGRQTLKVQLNAGKGACFPLHFDGDPALDGKAVTAVLREAAYLNPEWQPTDGGELELVPFPAAPVRVAPRFDRLVLFSSSDVLWPAVPSLLGGRRGDAVARRASRRGCLTQSPTPHAQSPRHRVLPSAALRLCLTLWFYRTAPAKEGAGDAASRRLAARYFYRDAWAASIEESHAPSPARDAALATHWEDTARIKSALEERGVDVTSLGADGGGEFPWFVG